jgi:hypothetical protein
MEEVILKIVCVEPDGEITIWEDLYEIPVEEIFRQSKKTGIWVGGKILQAYFQFLKNGKYHRVHLDLNKLNKILNES